ncbi:MAG: hypothetical protein J1F16_04190 [Muribaculaceae bacterium]|nr:hypothetical protein [Muribaculaceae bacterium]
MTGLGILILAVVFFWLVWPYIARWLKRKAMERAEDYMRASMGMPPREKKKRSAWGKKENTEDTAYTYRERRNPFGNERYGHEGPIIPKEYAEDVEFVETKDYSESSFKNTKEGSESYHESQISDAEYVEIKKSRSK